MTTASHSTQPEFANALFDPDLACPRGLKVWNSSDPVMRLAVHRNNVVSSLIDALADTFPVTQQLVGDNFFRAMAGIFVRQQPPRSPILALYGEQLAQFIETFEPVRQLPYLADMARLEYARVRACHAADASPMDEDQARHAMSDTNRIGALQLTCHPSVSTIASAYAIVSLWEAHQTDAPLGQIFIDQPQFAVIVRDGLDVLVLPASPGAVGFVDAILRGAPLAIAASAGQQRQADFDLTATLTRLRQHQVFTSLRHGPKTLAAASR